MTYITYAIRPDGRRYTKTDNTYAQSRKSLKWAREAHWFKTAYTEHNGVRLTGRRKDLPQKKRQRYRKAGQAWHAGIGDVIQGGGIPEDRECLNDIIEAAQEYFSTAGDPYYPDDTYRLDHIAASLDSLTENLDAEADDTMEAWASASRSGGRDRWNVRTNQWR